ncbi:hypothetical protein [Pedobacter sp. KLB.chiD]|uniref:hypothetical protein n=1 Tax=Pedobacter sp. KLB.chiD TaxID=3387402 RepID=UPI00399A386A
MVGTLAQLIAMVGYGNQCIENPRSHPNFFKQNSTFQYCNQVFFTAEKRKTFFPSTKITTVAENPLEWYTYLSHEGCQALRLYYEGSESSSNNADYQMAGMVGGGGTWGIETIYPKYSDMWYAGWKVTKEPGGDNRIWSVEYRKVEYKIQLRNLQLELETRRKLLSGTLLAITDFANRIGRENYVSVFLKALETLNDPNPEASFYHPDLLPELVYNLEERQLLFAASRAWVFGGMGSWNDMVMDDGELDKEYQHLSSALYSAINQAIIAALNAR